MKKALFFIVVLNSCCLFSLVSFSQIVGGNIYLQGEWLEMGMGPNGSFGVASSPAGYHPNPGTGGGTALAMVYDWGHDGWTVGTPPVMGDYTYPGTSQEGWSVGVNGTYIQAFQAGGYTGGSFGSISNVYSNTGGSAIDIWTGTTTGAIAGLSIVQETRVDTFASWCVVTTKLYNTTAAAMIGVYYERTCDPDNDEVWTGLYSTTNTITFQNDIYHRVEVSATGSGYPVAEDYMGICTKDCRARAFVCSGTIYPPNNLATLYSGASGYLYASGASSTGDNGMGVVWDIGTIAAGDSTTISYAYIFNNIYGVDSVFANLPICASAITGVTNLCVGQTSALTDTTTGGVWSSSNASVATISGAGVVTAVSPGSTVIYYEINSICCTATTTVTVGSTAIAGTPNVCVGATTNLSTTVSGGVWSSSNTGIATVNSAGTVSGVWAGNAVITYTPSTGCPGTSTVVVTAVPQPITGSSDVCVGATVTLHEAASGGSWTSGSTSIATINSANGKVTGISAGTAVITYSNSCGSATATITVNPTPVLGGVLNVCVGGTTTLSASLSGGTWSSSSLAKATVSATGVVYGVSAGNATINYTSPLGCLATVIVNVTSGPTAISGGTVFCTGSSVQLSDGVAGGAWSSGNTSIATISNSGVVTGIVTGSTIITYTVGSGCVATATITIATGAAAISGIVGLCTSSSVTLSDATPGGTWSSSSIGVATISPGGTVTGLSAGTAVITYTVGGGCVATASIVVHPPPSAITGNPQVCAGYNITLNNATPGGTWSSSNTAIATVSGTGQVGGIVPGSVTISYSTGPGCTVTWPMTVLSSPAVGAISGATTLCTGMSTALSDSSASGIWVSGTSSVATVSSSGVVHGVTAGTVTISYLVTSPSCGTATATHVITVVETPVAGVITGPDSVCVGSVIALSDTVSGGVWGSSNSSVTVTGGMVTGVTTGTATVGYAVTNACGTASTTKTIMVLSSPPAGNVSGISPVCVAAAFTMSDGVSGGAWSSSNTSVAIIDSVSGSTHTVGAGSAVITYTTGIGSGGCHSIATYTLTVTSAPDFTINGTVTPVQCYGDSSGSITISISGGVPPYYYIWSNTDTTTAITHLAPGMYYLNVHEPATQCIGIDSFSITEPDSLSIADSTTGDLCGAGTGSVITNVSGGTSPYTYHWSTGATVQNLDHLHAGVYTVTVTDTNGCTKKITAEVIEDTCLSLMPHNAITPNGDGVNDVWVIEGIQQYPGNEVHIFDKWGSEVYEKSAYDNKWNGGDLPDGTYFYLIKLNAKNITRGPDTFTGSLLIKR